MAQLALENIRIDPVIGDGVLFTAQINGVTHRFFVSRDTLADVERTQLNSTRDLLASFERQSDKVRRAMSKTLKLGTSSHITFLKTIFFS